MDRAFAERVSAEADRILGIIEKKLNEHRLANPQVREKIRKDAMEREIRLLEEELRDPVKANILNRRPKPSDTQNRQSEARRLNTRIRMLEKKIEELEAKLADSDRERLFNEILEPLTAQFGQGLKQGDAGGLDGKILGRGVNELFKFAANLEEFILGAIAECEKSQSRRRVLPGQDFRFSDLAKRFASGDKAAGPEKIAGHIQVIYTWIVQILAGYKSGSMSLYKTLWDSGLQEMCDAVRSGNTALLKEGKIQALLDLLPPRQVEAQIRDQVGAIVMKKST